MIFPCRDFVLGEVMATVVFVVYNIYGTNSQVTPDEYATIQTTYEQLVSNISDDRLQAVVLSLDIIKPDINDFGTKVFKIAEKCRHCRKSTLGATPVVELQNNKNLKNNNHKKNKS
ncbi:uncharacterized protein LOC113473965 [Diaphorina citri]|uniref:Uncharacterized protein LOC113473965 n=1 Tax=Diaphorina citri TaxID=121845 RepID=A0A3Q0JLV2_DIACI|nr:uncharacterized protein LOC113473965 [Diaphorina citri]